jgi:hyperosmotically inducible protein
MKANTMFRIPRSAALALALTLGTAAMATGCSSIHQGVGDSAEPAQDTWITTKVKTNIATLNDIDASDISVETNNGVVSLSGSVDSAQKRDRLVSAVRSVEGVRDVDTSQLNVTGQ